MLVGGRGIGGCGGRGGEAEGLDSEGVDAGDECYWVEIVGGEDGGEVRGGWGRGVEENGCIVGSLLIASTPW